MIINEKHILSILNKAAKKKGLSLEEAAALMNINCRGTACRAPALLKKLFETAAFVKSQIYGERIVFFAPLYTSDFCVNDCKYCNFHISNKSAERNRLTLREVEEQVKFLINMGHKRILLECGEDPARNNIDYIVSVIKKVYSVKRAKGNIRRLNVNIAATTVENYRRLKKAHIGTYQLFQETYHRKTYEKLHKGPKQDYGRQITAHIRAFKAGIDDYGLGVLFGLYDWRFEVLALIAHAQYLEKTLGVGPHTISVPRFCPAPTVNYRPQYPVSDADFLKLIAILRLAVPYTGLILSTRERPDIRKLAFKIGISQASAASVTSVGGYGKKDFSCHCEGSLSPKQSPRRLLRRPATFGGGTPRNDMSHRQFTISDDRPLDKVIDSILKDRLLPSFCTACYRVGRTGEKFMDIAKPGDIQNYCRPNGLLTFAEYLEDFATDSVYKKGWRLIDFYLKDIKDRAIHNKTLERIGRIKQGERDLYF